MKQALTQMVLFHENCHAEIYCSHNTIHSHNSFTGGPSHVPTCYTNFCGWVLCIYKSIGMLQCHQRIYLFKS